MGSARIAVSRMMVRGPAKDRFGWLWLAALALAMCAGCARRPVLHRSPLDMVRVRSSVKALSERMAPRPAGSGKCVETAHWIASQLTPMGYAVTVTSVRLPGGSQSAIVEARTKAEGKRLILAAHFDTAPDCSCPSDSAAGVALILEIARKMGSSKEQIPLTFLFLGAEQELRGGIRGYSAEKWLERLSAVQLGEIAGCLVLDRIGRGKDFRILHMRGTPDSAARLCADAGKGLEPAPTLETVEALFPRMPFEDTRIPTAWIEWWPDPQAGTPADTWQKLRWDKVEDAGLLALRAALDKSWRS